MAKIIWTRTDEAPLLATYSLKPIVEAFASRAGIDVDTADISLAGRILAQFPDRLGDKKVDDALAQLGELAKTPEANIIKLPNISASLVQLKKAIAELQAAGFDIPNYEDAQEKYDAVKGSAVNPVLREGNSDRRAPEAVKNFTKKHPHSMGEWSSDSKTNVATMDAGDFRHNEKSVIMPEADTLTIKLVKADGGEEVLKDGLKVEAGEVIDGTYMSARALDAFLLDAVKRAKDEGVLFSAHLKATMMKVSDPIIFGHVVRAYFKDVYDKYGEQLLEAGLDGENGLGAIYEGLSELENGEEIRAAFDKALQAARHDDPSVRQRAALWLGTHADETVAADLVRLLVTEPDFYVRETLTWAVVTRHTSTYPLLVEALRDDSLAEGPGRVQVLHALSKIRRPESVAEILPLADDEDDAVEEVAADAVEVDTTELTLQQVIECVVTLVAEKRAAAK